MNKYYLIGLVSLLLQGCGGSSGSTSSPTTTPEPQGLIIRGDLSPAVSQSMALVASVAGDSSDGATIKWTQTAGPNIELLADDAAVLAFDLLDAGDYGFSLSYTTAQGKQHTKAVSFSTGTATKILNVRRDHAARTGARVSLKLSAPRDPQTGDVVDGQFTKVVWKQTAGPTATLDSKNTNELLAIFNAPSVTKDQLMSFTVSAMHPNGQTYTDDAYILVQKTNSFPAQRYFKDAVAKVKAYQDTAPRASALESCIYSNYITTPCSFTKINLIGQEHSAPTVDDIMKRVVVSHQWMGDNFKEFLENEDPHDDFKLLLRSVSAIVISYDIRPSFYWGISGAIYLDAENLWRTPSQRDVIDVAADYRSEFGQELQYIMPWRYVKDNDYADSHYPKDLRLNRTTADMVPDLASLLYHELAHANDNFPPTSYGDITASSILAEINKRDGNNSTIAASLVATHPKQSDEMAGLGLVNFRGADPTDLQKSYLPTDIVDFYANDSAATEYAYSSIYEDVATLFDATMMSYRYGIERDEAVTPPYDALVGSESLAIAWGQRGRTKDPLVEPRAKFVLELMMPSLDADAVLASLPAVRQLPVDVSWKEALTFEETAKSPKRAQVKSLLMKRYQRPIALDIKQKYK